MLLDARTFDDGAICETDLCIVGAGAAGISLALGFVGGPVQVMLLESGGLEFDPATQALYQGGSTGVPYYPLDVCRLRFFGGSTNAWGGWIRPLDPIDLERRDWVADSGWPFGASELAPHYPAAHALCEVEDPSYDPTVAFAEAAGRYAQPLPVEQAGFEATLFTFSPPTRFGRRYLADLTLAPNIHCVLHANATTVETSRDGRRATGLDVRCLDGKRFAVRAKAFVLAAGGIENARLLLLSNQRQPAGLGNGYGLVGRYFMEHTHTERRLVPTRRRVPLDLYAPNFVARRLSGRLALTPAAQQKRRLLQYSANIKPVYFGEETGAWLQFMKAYERLHRTWRGDPISRFPPYEDKKLRLRQVIDVLSHPYDVARAAIGNAFHARTLISHFVLQSKAEQAPNPDSRIRLTSERDALGQNRVELNWSFLPIDRQTVRRGEDILDGELRRLKIGRLEDREPDGVDGWPTSLVGGWHQLGTTRMHADPRRGVVDADGRVHSLSNLFVAGGSVFPTIGTATPTLTIVALALRMGDHLRATVFARPPAANRRTVAGPSSQRRAKVAVGQ